MNDTREFYEFTWPGKREAVLEAGRPTDKVLRPSIEDSVNFWATENLYIEGDNLETLKILQRSYLHKVKMIYIDPPYNTGNDFIYNDRFVQDEETAREEFGLFDDEGQRNFTLSHYRENKVSNPRYHSDWCSMMYPRLRIARTLLSDDGVIFISIDDNEQANLRKICDEIFGENNFVSTLIWERAFAPKNDAKYVSASHDYILMYASHLEEFKIGRLKRTAKADARYSNPDNDPRGAWMSSDISVKTYNQANDYPITTPSGRVVEPPASRCWRLSPNAFADRLRDNRIWFGPNGDGVPRLKRFLSELRHEGITPMSILYYKDVGHSQEGAQELVKLLGGGYFDGPKPLRLLQRLMTLANLDDDSIILDFFAGSSTTAHAVMSLNASDSGHRKFIMIQLPEPCSPKSEAAKAGYSTIAEIGRERIKRAAKKLLTDSPLTAQQIDSGFRTLKLDTPNFKNVSLLPQNYSQEILDSLISNIKPDRSPLDLLFGVIAELGLPFSLKCSQEIIDGFTILTYGENDIIACFDSAITDEIMRTIAKRKPVNAVFRDSCFANANDRINFEQIFMFYAKNSTLRII